MEMPMERTEALAYLKEVLCANANISPNAIQLDKTNSSDYYRVRIKEKLDTQTIKDIAKKHNFQVQEGKEEIIVYKPT
jgi:hypothetical protein